MTFIVARLTPYSTQSIHIKHSFFKYSLIWKIFWLIFPFDLINPYIPSDFLKLLQHFSFTSITISLTHSVLLPSIAISVQFPFYLWNLWDYRNKFPTDCSPLLHLSLGKFPSTALYELARFSLLFPNNFNSIQNIYSFYLKFSTFIAFLLLFYIASIRNIISSSIVLLYILQPYASIFF